MVINTLGAVQLYSEKRFYVYGYHMHIWKLNLFAKYSWTPTDLYINVSVALVSTVPSN